MAASLTKENKVKLSIGTHDIIIIGEGGGSAEIPIIEQTESIVVIDPGCLNLWGEMASLNISLNLPLDDTVLNEYMIQFTSGSTATTLSLPANIMWTQEPDILPNTTYLISIINNLGVIAGFEEV